eukprot:2524479-Pleurochrysis_carterae.AAC.5
MARGPGWREAGHCKVARDGARRRTVKGTTFVAACTELFFPARLSAASERKFVFRLRSGHFWSP